MIIYPKKENSYFFNGEVFIAPPLYLGRYDNVENWTEITENEKTVIEQQWESEMINNAD